MSGETLNLAVREGDKVVALQEVEDTLAEKIHDDTDVAAEVEAVPQVDTTVAVLLVVGLERGEDSQFDPRRIAVFLHRPNDLDSNKLIASTVLSLDDLAEGALAK